MDDMTPPCRICRNSDNNILHYAREMMFGRRTEFEYVECGACGTVQIAEVPNLAEYYPPDYFSFESAEEVDLGLGWHRRLGARFAGRHLSGGNSAIGRLILKKKPWIKYHFPASLRVFPVGLNLDSKILDFGCGNGRILQNLHYFGFRDLTGADAFIEKDIVYKTGVNILKRTLSEIEPSFDLIMLHHSFEHFPEPFDSLKQINRLLKKEKYCLIRMPVASYAWEKYGVDWVQLDPPRHLFLFSERSFRDLAGEAGFVVEKVIYDSTAFQFWGSEQYLLDIPLNDRRSHNYPNDGTIFSDEQMDEWQRYAEDLNREGRGDQACFYLRKA